jgi:hypothetical protein
MKSNDEKKDDTSSLTDEERRTTTDSVLKELLQVVPPMLPESELKSKPRFIGDMLKEARERYPNATEEEIFDLATQSTNLTGPRLSDLMDEAREIHPEAAENDLANIAQLMNFYGWG